MNDRSKKRAWLVMRSSIIIFGDREYMMSHFMTQLDRLERYCRKVGMVQLGETMIDGPSMDLLKKIEDIAEQASKAGADVILATEEGIFGRYYDQIASVITKRGLQIEFLPQEASIE